MSRGAQTQAKELFLDALELEGPDRGAYLERMCGGDAELRRRVEGLLAAHEGAEGVLGHAADTPGAALSELAVRALDDLDVGPGDRVGDFRIESELGTGGFGRVFRAEQLHPVRRHVALKVVKLGMDTRRVIARFEAERQALALMDHPHIARVLDAGATEGGRPYFVMELVDGEPITRFAARNDLGTRSRLELFREVCLALHHAHTKGVLHRDIKPSNVLVATVDGRPVPKVIDFGIAKALDTDDGAPTQFTEDGHLVGTPAYMSPEQAASSRDVDTRSDVYSLGVLLYELLSGGPPFELAGRADFTDLLRRIRDEDPPAPSARARARWASGDSTAVRDVPSELDWIALRCLDKDRARRYPSAFALSEDVRRYLDGMPVEAAPPSRWYRARKLALRHRGPVAAAALVLAALLVGVVGTSVGLLRASRANADLDAALAEQERTSAELTDALAEQRRIGLELDAALEEARRESEDARRQERVALAVADFLIEDLFRAVRPSVAQGEGWDVTLGEVLDVAADRLAAAVAPGGRFADSPLIAGRVGFALGGAFEELGRPQDAIPVLERAADDLEAALGPEHRDALVARGEVAAAEIGAGRYEAGLARYAELLPALDAALPAGDAQRLRSRMRIGTARWRLGRYDDAASVLREALAIADAHGRARSDDALRLSNTLALVEDSRGNSAEAEPLFRSTAEARLATLGPDAPSTLSARTNLASFLARRGQDAEARELYEDVLARQIVVMGPEHPQTLATRYNLARLAADADDPLAAVTEFEEVLELQRRALGENHLDTLRTLAQLGSAYGALGRYAEAEVALRDSLERTEARLGPNSPDALSRRKDYAALLYTLGRLEDSTAEMERVLAAEEATLGRTHPRTLISLLNLGQLAERRDDDAAREAFLLDARERARSLPIEERIRVEVEGELYRLYRTRARWEEALGAATSTWETLVAVEGANSRHASSIAMFAQDALYRLGRDAEADEVWAPRARVHLDELEAAGAVPPWVEEPPSAGN